jgi:hypothetical protein
MRTGRAAADRASSGVARYARMAARDVFTFCALIGALGLALVFAFFPDIPAP